MNKQTVPSLEKAIRILNTIATATGETTSSALARKVDASQPTAYRILKTLEAADWIKPNPNNGYSLSLGLLPILHHLDNFDRYGRASQTLIDNLSRELDLTVKLTIRQGNEQVIVSIGESRRPFGVSVPLGGRFPVVWGSPGACLLSSLSDNELENVIKAIPKDNWKHETPEFVRCRVKAVQEKNISESLGEHYLGLDTLSAPLLTPIARAALTIVGFRGEMSPESLPQLRKRLVKTAQEIERTLEFI